MKTKEKKKYSIDQSVIDKHKINFVRRSNHIHEGKYDYSKVEYKNSTTKVIIICPNHGEFLQTPGNHLTGRNCKKCSLESLKSNIGEFLEKSKKIHGDKYDYSLVKYVNNSTRVQIICKDHGIFEQTPFGHITQGHNCPSCSPQAKLTTKDFIKRSRSFHGDEYDYSLSEYKGSSIPIKIICKEHGIFEQSPTNHWAGSKCTKCSGAYSPSTEEWIKKAKKVHGEKYKYSKAIYVNGGTKVDVECPKHGVFRCLPGNHVDKKSGCPKCSGVGLKPIEDFLLEAGQKHGGKFDYSLAAETYKNSKSKIKIICPTHGEFTQGVKIHLKSKYACPKCSGIFKETLEGFVDRAREVYGEKYDYSKTVFTRMIDKVNITCPEHGEFHQGAQNFLNGNGCILCNSGSRGIGARRIQFLKELLSKEELYVYDPILLYTIFQQSGYERIIKRTGVNLNSLISTPPGSEERRKLVDMIREGINSEEVEDIENELEREGISESQQEINDLNPDNLLESHSPELPDTDRSFSQVLQEIKSLDDLIYSFDEEAISFMESFYTNKIWRLLIDKKTSVRRIKEMGEKDFSKTIQKNFLREYKEIKSIKIPEGYVFGHQPNLMQLLVVHRLIKNKNHINLSDMGSGKSLGAILASKVLKAKKVLLPCPNSIMEDWIKKIPTYFDGCKIYTLKKLECIRDERGNVIEGVDPKLYTVIDKRNPVLPESVGTSYLIVNWESFQWGEDSESLWSNINFLNNFDLIIPDEIQGAKQSDERFQSKRRQNFEKLICSQRDKGHEMYLMPLSGTAVTNNLTESKKLIELTTGRVYDDLSTFPSIRNAVRHHQVLTTIGTRSSSNFKTKVNRKIIEVDGLHLTHDIISVGKGEILELEKILIPLKLDSVIPLIKKGEKYILYTHFVTDIIPMIGQKLSSSGISYGIFTGDRKDGLEQFKNGEVDVLIGSRPISTGIDGLQLVCNNLIELILPWTNAEKEQLEKRIIRPGSKFKEVNITEVHVTIDTGDKTWSWDRRKKSIIDVKKDLTDCVMDGIIPESKSGNILELMENYKQELQSWIERLEDGREIIGQRERIDLKFSETFSPIQRSEYSESEFRNFNRSWATKKSQTLHLELSKDPREWHRYHQLYREARKDWTERPYEVIATELYRRKDWEVGDFGCGDNLLKNYLNGNKVHSFDHVSIDGSVISCDISSVPLDSDSLDAAVYSLSLMGTNYMGYLKEGHRVLKPFGKIFICEPLSSGKWDRGNGIEDGIIKSLQESGFTSPKIFKRCDKFIYVIAEKN